MARLRETYLSWPEELWRLRRATRLTLRQYVIAMRDLPDWRQAPGLGSPLEARLPWVTGPAIRALKVLCRQVTRVIEFGAGGSTLFFLDNGCSLTTVEHDSEWIARITQSLSPALQSRWSVQVRPPQRRSSSHEWDPSNWVFGDSSESDLLDFSRYAKSPMYDPTVDLVLVDGRARPTCLVHSEEMFPNAILVLDQSERAHYAPAMSEITRRRGKARHFPGSIRGFRHLSRTSMWDAC